MQEQNKSDAPPDNSQKKLDNTVRGIFGMNRPSEAEQNRLIQAHIVIVAPIAAEYRGRKGIPFEDLVSEGMAGLVQAARNFDPTFSTKFSTFANARVRGSIKNFIDGWQHLVPVDDISEEGEDRVHWWQIWSDIPYEGWTTLPASAEEMLGEYQEFAEKRDAAAAAFISLSKRERQMIDAHFLRTPKKTLDQIARDHKLSYIRTVEIINRAIKKMAAIVKTIERRKVAVAA